MSTPSGPRSPAPRAARPRSRRWLRLVVPFLVLASFWSVIGLAHWLEQPDLGDAGTMSPTGTGPDGSSALARRLAADGVTIVTVTSTEAAMKAATFTDSTIFVPAPDFVTPLFGQLVDQLPGTHRIVLVRPGPIGQLALELPAYPVYDHWAAKVVAPDCSNASLEAAGPATLRRTVYQLIDPGPSTSMSCYHGAVVGSRRGQAEIVLVGATEPFRNSRIGEAGNADFAAALLREHDRLIWLDLHRTEPVDLDLELPDIQLPDYRRDDDRSGSTGSPLIDAFPSGLWALLLACAAAFVLLALAKGRRLGGPVPEPLPVLVPAAESVTGRGRLYQRAQAQTATLEALRAAAIRRMTRLLNPFGAAPGPDELAAQIAQRTGRAETAVRGILFDDQVNDEAGLVRAVAALDELVAAVLNSDTTTRPNQGGPA